MATPAPEQPKEEAQTQVPAPSAPKDEQPIENMIPQSRLNEVIQQRDEARKKAEALEKARQDDERKRLEEANQYKELYEKAQAELSSAKSKAEQVDAYEETLQGVLNAEIESLPEEFRDVVPDGLTTKQKIDWLAKNKAKFIKPAAYDIGAGKTGVSGNGKGVELSPAELQIAKDYGLKPEEYAKYKENN